VPVKSVKVYRIVHLILSPQELARGMDPWDKTKHMPYFLGEHDVDGNLVKDGEMDPFLYWYLPMLNVERDYADFRLLPNVGNGPTRNYGVPASKDTIVLDCLEMHAAGKVSENKKKGSDHHDHREIGTGRTELGGHDRRRLPWLGQLLVLEDGPGGAELDTPVLRLADVLRPPDLQLGLLGYVGPDAWVNHELAGEMLRDTPYYAAGGGWTRTMRSGRAATTTGRSSIT